MEITREEATRTVIRKHELEELLKVFPKIYDNDSLSVIKSKMFGSNMGYDDYRLATDFIYIELSEIERVNIVKQYIRHCNKTLDYDFMGDWRPMSYTKDEAYELLYLTLDYAKEKNNEQ